MSVMGHMGRLMVGVACVAMVGMDVARAQCNAAWAGPQPAGLDRQRFAMVYDSGRAEVVLFGGTGDNSNKRFGDTWVWNGSSWRRVAVTGPAGRMSHEMAYDSARGKIVLFGGTSTTGGGVVKLGDTWEWDGTEWAQVASTGPAARTGHAMAYDAARGKIVLFGGVSSGYRNDTWEWDGAVWTEVSSGGPIARSDQGLAYDAARQRVVMFGGGDSAGNPLMDTWAWDGAAWAQMAATGPAGRGNFAMDYDSTLGRVVLYGGIASPPPPGIRNIFGDTWAWDGSVWTQLTTTGPGRRYWSRMAHGADGRMVLMGGECIAPAHAGDTWTLSGSAWSKTETAPRFDRMGHAAAYDSARGRLVVFGGTRTGVGSLTSVQEWDGHSWTEIEAPDPNATENSAMAYDAARQRVVLFGGTGPVATWLWDGATWTVGATTEQSPPNRQSHAMAYDAHRERVVMWGGRNSGSSTQDADVWEWDGAVWTRIEAAGPALREGHAMAYDPSQQRVMMFGGGSGDTWEWNGTAWTVLSLTGPSITYQAMAYDEMAGRMVIFGGISSGQVVTTRYWTGSVWSSPQQYAFQPSARSRATMVYDTSNACLLMYGGDSSGDGSRGDVWYQTFGPAFDEHPIDTDVEAGGKAVIEVVTVGTGPFTYHWRKDGVELVDGGAISGATTDRLRIDPAAAEHAGMYDCVATNACRSVTSTSAVLTATGAECRADLNGDGFVDFADYLEFLNLFDAQDPRVDFNMDGIVDFADYLEFLNLFDAGC